MKRTLSLILCLVCITVLLNGCAVKSNETIPEETTLNPNIMQKEDPSKDDTLNILMIGSSFCFYTGQSCIGHTWRPDYDLDEALIPTLQNAAHQAASSRSAAM